MINPFVSPLFAAGEVLLGLSLTLFGAIIAAHAPTTLDRVDDDHWNLTKPHAFMRAFEGGEDGQRACEGRC